MEMLPNKKNFIINFIFTAFMTCLLLMLTPQVKAENASQIDGMIGYFSLKAKNSSNTTTMNNLGIFAFAYKNHFTESVDLSLGYSIYTLSLDTSDLGYGFDLGIDYYPLHRNKIADFSTLNIYWNSSQKIVPYIGLRFHQRQYQSIQTGYAGAGLDLGARVLISKSLHALTSIRAIYLNGPLGSKIQEYNVLGGVGVSF